MRRAVVIVAAGLGVRLGGTVPKQYLPLAGEAVLRRTLRAALAPEVGADAVQVAIDPAARTLYDEAVAGLDDKRLRPPVSGGATRSATVLAGLDALAADPPATVLVHDAARPFAPPALFERLAREVEDAPHGAIAAEPVVDALWHGPGGDAQEPRPRQDLWRAQTPQAFPFAALLAAHRAEAAADRPAALDDAEVFRRAGHRVRLVPGPRQNIKITRPEDMAEAERHLEAETAMARAHEDIRIGHGFDVHRFVAGDAVWLCGVRLAHTAALSGHSDADVGLHALADALYGAIGDGDIGTHFPPSDARWKGAESHIFVAHAGQRVAERGGRIANVDVTLLCEAPKIAPHAEAMRARVGEILGLAPERVSVKATTMERMGFVGREDGMGALATATVCLPAAP